MTYYLFVPANAIFTTNERTNDDAVYKGNSPIASKKKEKKKIPLCIYIVKGLIAGFGE